MHTKTDYEHVYYINEEGNDLIGSGYTTPGYYFYDETEAYCYGPYTTPEIASKMLIEYGNHL